MEVKWSEEDSTAANAEGWDVFLASRDDSERHEIQKVDDAYLFISDDEALGHVYSKALKGSDLHCRALLYTLLVQE